MAKARAIVKRRQAVQNIRKITRTMELIATARFKKALDRATEAEAYTRKIAELAADLSANAGEVRHPLLQQHPEFPADRTLFAEAKSAFDELLAAQDEMVRVAERLAAATALGAVGVAGR